MGYFLLLSKPETVVGLELSEIFLFVSGVLLVIGIWGEYRLPWWHHRLKLFELFVLLGCGGELISDAAIFALSTHLQSISDLEIARLNSKAEQSGKDAESAKATAKGFERDVVNAKLELAKLTAPIYLVPVLHGTATPDLSPGFNQRVFLTANTRINPPLLPPLGKDEVIAWTLFIDQDSVGSHVFNYYVRSGSCSADWTAPKHARSV
jgi:hypothetical protein